VPIIRLADFRISKTTSTHGDVMAVPNEDRVRNAVVGHIAGKGYSRNLKLKANNERGVDIYAEHARSSARRIFIESKGHSPAGNKTVAILTAWGQLLSRITSLNANRVHGLAFPKDWERNVVKLSSHVAAKKLNVRYYFVDARSNVEEYTAEQLRRKYAADLSEDA
jgi:hypothetical protein